VFPLFSSAAVAKAAAVSAAFFVFIFFPTGGEDGVGGSDSDVRSGGGVVAMVREPRAGGERREERRGDTVSMGSKVSVGKGEHSAPRVLRLLPLLSVLGSVVPWDPLEEEPVRDDDASENIAPTQSR